MSGRGRGPRRQTPFQISEERRIELEEILQQFKSKCGDTDGAVEYAFPPTLSSEDRRFVHLTAQSLGFTTKSFGTGPQRHLRITKRTGDCEAQQSFMLSSESKQKIMLFLQNLHSNDSRNVGSAGALRTDISFRNHPKMTRTIPPRLGRLPFHLFKQKTELPVYNFKNEILNTVRSSRTPVLIQGTTGCGKSTQVPQYLLEDAAQRKEKVNIWCTVPRRMAAYILCDRVAFERGEEPGQTVGYKIRLEGCSSSQTALTFCTGGILVRSLSDSTFLDDITHLILDEIHERDKFTDFVLGYLKRHFLKYANLRIILMGASINFGIFSTFFNTSAMININSRIFPVETLYLNDVLKMVEFEDSEPAELSNKSVKGRASVIVDHEKMKVLFDDVALNGVKESACELVKMVKEGKVSPDYEHPNTHVTILGAICCRGFSDLITELVMHGVDVQKMSNGVKPREYIQMFCEDLLHLFPEDEGGEDALVTNYMKTVDVDRVDLALIWKLVRKIHTSVADSSGILVFLPGFEELVTLQHLIRNDNSLDQQSFKIYLLHSTIEGDQRSVFKRLQGRVRKIILSTNIAETSVTIDGVAYVIDSGKVKEKTYDSQTHCSMLCRTWVSRASAEQRKGRAGRNMPGTCYRLYTQKRFTAFDEFHTCEVQRSSLQELCLYSRTFLPKEVRIPEFFTCLPEPPSQIAVNDAVRLLKEMDAINFEEELTDLGKILVEFPMEPSLAKIVIYSVVLRCVGPILDIISSICYRDPFVIPMDNYDKLKARVTKEKLADDSNSDHIALSHAFQDWTGLETKTERTKYCNSYFLSDSSLRVISGIKEQLLELVSKVCLRSSSRVDWNFYNCNSKNWSVIKAALALGLYPNICKLSTSKAQLHNKIDSKIRPHHGSIISTDSRNLFLPSDWVIYDDMSRNSLATIVQGCTVISTLTVALLGGVNSVEVNDSGISERNPEEELDEGETQPTAFKSKTNEAVMKVGDWIVLKGNRDEFGLICELRGRFDGVIRKFLRTGALDKVDLDTIQIVVDVLTLEDMDYKKSNRGENKPKSSRTFNSYGKTRGR